MFETTTTDTKPDVQPAAVTTKVKAQAFCKDMSLTPDEFYAALPKAVKGIIIRTDKSGLSFRVVYNERVAIISCRPVANRRIGSLSLPRLKVDIELDRFDQAQTDQFFKHFDLAFLRMGG